MDSNSNYVLVSVGSLTLLYKFNVINTIQLAINITLWTIKSKCIVFNYTYGLISWRLVFNDYVKLK